MNQESKVFKVVFIGEGGVGKSVFLGRHLTGEFKTTYLATLGCEVNPIRFETNYGPITFNVWDCAGQEQYMGLGDGYYIGADAAIVFFDVTNEPTFNNIRSWITSFKRVVPNGQIVVCGNKCDVKDRKVKPKTIQQDISKNYYYHEVSAKTNYNFEKPFLSLARLLTGHNDLNFNETLPCEPIELTLNY